MQRDTRNLSLDICNYEDEPLCNIYDNTLDISGQAVNVYKVTERNGWKELNFTLPDSYFNGEEDEPNYRLDYLIADYRIRAIDDNETDWYIISEPKILHDNVSKTVTVRASHIAITLKTKALDLEFSDEEGNNVGTANALLTTILDGTGWHVGYVADFLEDDGATKVRSLVAPAKTGALGLINKLCELFDARPEYHGEGRIVDIVPINPFSEEILPGEIPEEVTRIDDPLNVLEVRYSVNAKNIERTHNTENIATRLYAYGAYGSEETGFCSLQTATHTEHSIQCTATAGQEKYFRDAAGYPYYFIPTENVNGTLIWSDLDFTSRSYVWNGDTEHIYRVTSTPQTSNYTELQATSETVQNYFPFLFDFDYYDSVGLLSDEKLLEIASYQRALPELFRTSVEKSSELNEKLTELSNIAESYDGFLRLDISSYSTGPNGELQLNIRKTDTYPDGVIYRSDYDEARRNYFTWYPAEQLKDNGDPVQNIGSLVYIIHDTNPTTWQIAYVKQIDDRIENGKAVKYAYGISEGEPSKLTLWINTGSVPAYRNTDKFYLFCSFGASGKLHQKLDEAQSIKQELENLPTQITPHPVLFTPTTSSAPSTDVAIGGVAWNYRYNPNDTMTGSLFFCDGRATTRNWARVYVDETEPAGTNGQFFLNYRTARLYQRISGRWELMDSVEWNRLAQSFGQVFDAARRLDIVYKGLSEKQQYVSTSILPPGNYAFKSDYGFYWIFTTTQNVGRNQTIYVDTTKNYLMQDNNVEHVVPVETRKYESVTYPAESIFNETNFRAGTLDTSTGMELDSNEFYRSVFLSTYEQTVYEFSVPAYTFIIAYDINNNFLEYRALANRNPATGRYETLARCRYVRIVSAGIPGQGNYLRVQNYLDKIYINDNAYTVLKPVSAGGDVNGINTLMGQFSSLADEIYNVDLPAYESAQAEIKSRNSELAEDLGDLLRDGWWQENNYVEGDEKKLYDDALDNLQEVAKPETTYTIDYLDLYGSDNNEYAVDPDVDAEWPDVQIGYAVHLIDEELDTNQYAYIDRISKCYDQPWKTSIEINTRLSLIGQHEFTDVLARIAEVAGETKAKQTLYAAGASGAVLASRIEGFISANKTYILGGASSWYTDAKGNIIFEAADGLSAMMLCGRGWMIASGKDAFGDWDWRYMASGLGMNADYITSGHIQANLIEAGMITTDMLHSSVGQELEIGSNKALLLYATEDGFRPSGSLKTNDSYIEITRGYDADHPAKIDIKTGGTLNLYSGAAMNLETETEMNIKAGSNLNLTGGSINVASDGHINVTASGKFTLDSDNLKVKDDGTVEIEGKVTATSGKIAGYTIGTNNGVSYLQAGNTNSVSSSAAGVYLGTDGINIGGTFKYEINGNTATMNVLASNITLGDYSSHTLKAEIDTAQSTTKGAKLEIDAINGTVKILSSNTIDIKTGETLTLLSGGNVIIGNGTKPFTFGANASNAYLYNGYSDVNTSSNTAGVYLGTDGINIGGGKFVYSADGSVAKMSVSADNINLGTTSLQGTLESIDETIADNADIAAAASQAAHDAADEAQNAADAAQADADAAQETADTATAIANSKSKHFTCTSLAITTAKINNELYKVGDTWTCTDTHTDINGNNVCYYYQYICTQVSNPRNATTDWVQTGTAVTAGAGLAIDAENGTIDMIAANTISIVSGATISVAANKQLSLTTAGTIIIGNASKAFTIGATGEGTTANPYRAYMYNTMSSMSSSSDGVYLGTDGIGLGGGKFKVTAAGSLHAVTGDIAGWTIGGTNENTNYIGSGSTRAASSVGMSNQNRSGWYAFWAGGFQRNNDGTYKRDSENNLIPDINSAVFSVDGLGKLTASDADIKGTIRASSLYIGGSSVLDSNNKIATSALADADAVTKASSLTVTNGLIQLSCIDYSSTLATKSELSSYATITMLSDEISAGVWDELSGNTSGIKIEKTKVTISSTGTLVIGSFTFGNIMNGNSVTRSYITSNISKNAYNNSTSAVYLGTDGIGLGANAFYVSSAGYVTATSGQIGGWYLGSDFIANNSVLNKTTGTSANAGATVGMRNTTGENIVFWAGKAYNDAPKFSVKASGAVNMTDLTVSMGTNSAGNNYFNVTNTGVLTARGASIHGTFSSSSTPIHDKTFLFEIGNVTTGSTNYCAIMSISVASWTRQSGMYGSTMYIRLWATAATVSGNSTTYTNYESYLRFGIVETTYETGGESGTYSWDRLSLYITPHGTAVTDGCDLGCSSYPWRYIYCDNLQVDEIRSHWIFATKNISGKEFITTSSRRVKYDIKSINSFGDIIDRLQPSSFIFVDDEEHKTRFGLIYEDTVSVLPEICRETNGVKAINYIDLIPVLLKEIQDLRKRVKAIEG